MKLIYPIMLLSGALSLAACSSRPADVQTDSTPPQQHQISYQDMHDYGLNMGCKAAMQNVGTPESDWANAPRLSGTHEQYLAGWKAGFEKCRIGLGPVQLPVKQ
ncbi:hypothetical protein [Shewanella sp. GXUN23E]|uniref:hypothetical protein n=1 Tax=Shewanella sp. GXUN23E TaxID=3422498 RepID=UPI003D7EB454